MAQAPLQEIHHSDDSVLEMNLDCGIDTLADHLVGVDANGSICRLRLCGLCDLRGKKTTDQK